MQFICESITTLSGKVIAMQGAHSGSSLASSSHDSPTLTLDKLPKSPTMTVAECTLECTASGKYGRCWHGVGNQKSWDNGLLVSIDDSESWGRYMQHLWACLGLESLVNFRKELEQKLSLARQSNNCHVIKGQNNSHVVTVMCTHCFNSVTLMYDKATLKCKPRSTDLIKQMAEVATFLNFDLERSEDLKSSP